MFIHKITNTKQSPTTLNTIFNPIAKSTGYNLRMNNSYINIGIDTALKLLALNLINK